MHYGAGGPREPRAVIMNSSMAKNSAKGDGEATWRVTKGCEARLASRTTVGGPAELATMKLAIPQRETGNSQVLRLESFPALG